VRHSKTRLRQGLIRPRTPTSATGRAAADREAEALILNVTPQTQRVTSREDAKGKPRSNAN